MLRHYFTEIISKEQWSDKEHKYRKQVRSHISMDDYKKSRPILKELFTALNGGRFAQNVVFDLQSENKVKITADDQSMIKVLEMLGYSVSPESYSLGVVEKDGKQKNILEIINGFNSKIKTKQQLELAAEKNPGAKKQLDAIKELDNKKLIKGESIDLTKLSIYKNNNDKIVFSMNPRVIASQSTEVGWTSCMNLITGEFKEKVGSGISAGVFVAFFVKAGDEKELSSPKGRVLFKPYEDKATGKYLWKADIIYGTVPDNYRAQAKKIINDKMSELGIESAIDSGKVRMMNLRRGVYADRSEERLLVGDKENIGSLSEKEQIKLIDKFPSLFEKIKNPSKNVIIKYVLNKKIHDVTKETLRDFDNDVIKSLIEAQPLLISRVENPSEEMQMILAEKNPELVFTYDYVKDPSRKALLYAFKKLEELNKSKRTEYEQYKFAMSVLRSWQTSRIKKYFSPELKEEFKKALSYYKDKVSIRTKLKLAGII